MYRYGVKEIRRIDGRILVSPTYCPKNTTMRRKLGNLPVEYRRENVDGEGELALFEKLEKKFKYNLRKEDAEKEEGEEQGTVPLPPTKRIKVELLLPPPPPPHTEHADIVSLLSEDDDFAHAQQFIFEDLFIIILKNKFTQKLFFF